MPNLTELPAINATLNGLSAILLLAGLFFIRRGERELHRRCMLLALLSSSVFLVGYVIHKVLIVQGVNTPFGGPEALRPIYLFLLATHVVLAMVIVPLALVTIGLALRARFPFHKKVARWTWPIWMYVSVTGVLIYLSLYQFWPQA